MTITISASGIALDGPLVAGEKVAVTVSGLALAAEDKPTLALLARFPDALLASVELAESETAGTWTGELDTATKQTALFFATARADERRDAALELVSGRVSLARLTVPMANSALCPKPDGSPFASPVYIPVPGPPGTGGDPYDQPPEMDGEAAAGVSDEYARGDHRHPTDSSRASAADVTAIQNIIPSTATQTNKLATAADIPAVPVSSVNAKTGAVVLSGDDVKVGGDGQYAGATIGVAFDDLDTHVFPGLRHNIAAEFDATAHYAVGQLVFKGEYLYRCTTAHTGAWDASDFTGASVEDVLKTKANSADLSTVATTGDYGDLINTPTIPAAQVNSDWNAASGVAQILNKPTIPDVSGKADAASLAPAFSTSSTYAVGDYVTHEGLLYKCTTAVSTAGAWNAANWTQVAVTDEMGGGGGGGRNLPYDAEVEYIEAEWNQYVDTGIPANTIVSAYGVFMTPTAGQRFYFGARASQSSGNLATAFIPGFGFRMAYGTNGNVLVASNQTTAWTNAGFYGTTAFYNGVNTSYTQSGTPTGLNAYLLTTNNNGTPIGDVSYVPLRLRSFIIETASGRVRDFIAVRKDGVGYLYDRISQTFFYNANSGTGSFAYGADIENLYPSLRYAFASTTPTVSGTSATVACEDRAINDFTVATGITSLTITPPAAVTGRARDFFCRVTLTDSSLPTVTLSGATIDIGATEVAGMTQGINLLMFTEIASGHWLASRRSAS